MVWRGPIAEFLQDPTTFVDLEGALNSGKTTACLWKVLTSLSDHPGISWYLCRYSDGDTQTKLKPAFETICLESGNMPKWNPTELCYVFPNKSRAYMFGLKSQDQLTRYSKIRGLGVAGIYNDQTEELPHDLFLELIGRLRQPGFPHQMILSPNPTSENHWLSEEFPEDNHLRHHRYYSVSIYDNAPNLAPDTVAGLEIAYPPTHANHRSLVLGKRGLSVIGEPVYKGAFLRSLHESPLQYFPMLPLYESIDFGKHHPCVVWRQDTPYGQTIYLGGILGQNLFLEDFAPIVRKYRGQWFPDVDEVLTCCDPAGSHQSSQGLRKNGVEILKDLGFNPTWKDHSNAPDVRLAMIERMAGAMRRRTPQGEAFGVNDTHFLRISPESVTPWKFLADGFEAGYVWDQHEVSVGSKRMRKPKKDGWYEHGMNCCEYLELNFGQGVMTAAEVERWAQKRHRAEMRRAQQDWDEADGASRHRVVRFGRRGVGL
jgi:hypothetical protein